MTGDRLAGDARDERHRLRRALVWADALAILVTLLGASALWLLARSVFGDGAPVPPTVLDRHLLAVVLIGLFAHVSFRAQHLYDFDRILAGSHEYARIAQAVTYAVLAASAVSFMLGGLPLVSRSWLALVWVVAIGVVVTERTIFRRMVRAARQRGRLQTRVAIVGASAAAVAIAERLREAKGEGMIVRGFLDEYLPLGEPIIDDLAVIGRPGDLVHESASHPEVDEYVLVPQALPHDRLEEIVALMIARDRPVVRMAVTPSALLTNGVLVAARGSIPMVTLRRARIAGFQALVKRAFDIAGAALLCLAVMPFALVDLVQAWAAGVRPLVRRQAIYGPEGRPVMLWLLARGVSTRLPVRGMPALLGVLLGRLSLVGPRPVPVDPGAPVPIISALTAMRPGLTGPWRLLGGDAPLDQQATHDLAYVRNYTIWEDLRVVIKSARLLGTQPRRRLLGRWEAASLERRSPEQPTAERRPLERVRP